MRVAIITSVSLRSSTELAEHLRDNGIHADVFRPYKDNSFDFTKYDYVLSYGCSADTRHKQRFNTAESVSRCVDKVKTFQALKGLYIPRWFTRVQDVPKDVECLVVREDRCGRKADGLNYWYKDSDVPIPNGDLYTEYFEHNREYRVTSVFGTILVYFKRFSKETGNHEFILQRTKDYPEIVDQCQQAAKLLGIDYVSFDVVAKTKRDFVILEANSGTILTDEASTAIVEYFLNL
jgi:hypothetical protein